MTSIDAAESRPVAIRPAAVRRRPASRRLRAFAADEGGATAVEYGLLLVGLTLVILTAVSAIGTNIGGVMNKVSNALR